MLRVAYVRVRICPTHRRYMAVLLISRKCSILLPVFHNLFETFKNSQDAPKMIDFIGRAPTCHFRCTDPGQIQVYTIKQIRGFVEFILQPDLKLIKIVPDPTINTERDESSQTHHTVSTTLLPSGINGTILSNYEQF